MSLPLLSTCLLLNQKAANHGFFCLAICWQCLIVCQPRSMHAHIYTRHWWKRSRLKWRSLPSVFFSFWAALDASRVSKLRMLTGLTPAMAWQTSCHMCILLQGKNYYISYIYIYIYLDSFCHHAGSSLWKPIFFFATVLESVIPAPLHRMRIERKWRPQQCDALRRGLRESPVKRREDYCTWSETISWFCVVIYQKHQTVSAHITMERCSNSRDDFYCEIWIIYCNWFGSLAKSWWP